MGFVLQLHSILRWILLAAALVVTVKALIGWLGKQKFTRLDDQLGMGYTMVVDVQVLVGLIIWLFGTTGLKQLASAMSNPYARFIALEHAFLMLIALAFAHIGRTRTKKAASDAAKHRAAFIFYLLSFVFIVLIFLLQMMLTK